jgi:isocitrate dehydrogenase kinase/phosphatase
MHHQRAAWVVGAVLVLDAVFGLLMAAAAHVPAWHGIYCTTGLTTTDGCDIAFSNGREYVIATLAMVLFVPLWTGAFSLFTTGLLADHVDKRHRELIGRDQ